MSKKVVNKRVVNWSAAGMSVRRTMLLTVAKELRT